MRDEGATSLGLWSTVQNHFGLQPSPGWMRNRLSIYFFFLQAVFYIFFSFSQKEIVISKYSLTVWHFQQQIANILEQNTKDK